MMKNTAWLAKYLGVSVKTIERLRATDPSHLPPFINIGKSIRYNESTVHTWAETISTHTSIKKNGE